MKTQHTYPPLLVADSGRNTWVVFYNLPTVGDQELNQKVIAEVEDVELARLIAAAPELLEALCLANNWLPDLHKAYWATLQTDKREALIEDWNKIKATIKKAKGE